MSDVSGQKGQAIMAEVHRFSWGVREDAQVWVVHCGSKSTPLIAQLLREIGLQCRIVSAEGFESAWDRRTVMPKLVILSGGDQSVYDEGSITLSSAFYRSLVESTVLLGICYGAQLLAQLAGGKVERAAKAEFGPMFVCVHPGRRFGDYSGGQAIMNHRDEITQLPEKWLVVGSTERCRYALVGRDNVWGVQFHPEMDHTQGGDAFLHHVAFHLAHCKKDYVFDAAQFVRQVSAWMVNVLPLEGILCGVSGGVDSSVAFKLLRTVHPDARGIFVDNGWCREGEMAEVQEVFGNEGMSYVDASKQFYDAIESVPYPINGHPTECEYQYYDRVRRVMGAKFIDVFVATARGLSINPEALVQGTNAADVIESTTGLKAHHNVSGLPGQLGVAVVEPLAGLYKTEIRKLAEFLGLPRQIVHRQPFPGPGLAIRSWGPLTREDAPPLRQANHILEEVMRWFYPNYGDRPHSCPIKNPTT